MSHSDSNSHSPESKSKSILSRRLLLKSSALLCGVKLSGAAGLLAMGQAGLIEPLAADDKADKAEKVEPFVDKGFRLFVIEPEDNQTFARQVLQKIDPMPFAVQLARPAGHNGPQLHRLPEIELPIQEIPEPAIEEQAEPVPDTVLGRRVAPQARAARQARRAPPAMIWMTWASQESADKIAKIEGVKSVSEKGPKHLVETGLPAKAGGTLALMLLPSKGNHQPSENAFASVQQVVLEFREAATGNDAVTFTAVKRKGLNGPAPIGEITQEQITVEFTTPELDEQVLEMIKSHPQVMYLNWSAPFTEFSCQGCGMG